MSYVALKAPVFGGWLTSSSQTKQEGLLYGLEHSILAGYRLMWLNNNINQPFGNLYTCLYHLSMVKWGMVYYYFKLIASISIFYLFVCPMSSWDALWTCPGIPAKLWGTWWGRCKYLNGDLMVISLDVILLTIVFFYYMMYL